MSFTLKNVEFYEWILSELVSTNASTWMIEQTRLLLAQAKNEATK